MLRVMHLQAGGCGGCALELELVSLPTAGLVLTDAPRHADLLLVSGAPGPEMMRAMDAAWIEMGEPKQLVLLGDCAINGGAFAGGYAGIAGLGGGRLPVALHIPGSPPPPTTIIAALRALLDTPADPPDQPIAAAAEPVRPTAAAPPVLPALLPAAPRRRLGDGGSSGS